MNTSNEPKFFECRLVFFKDRGVSTMFVVARSLEIMQKSQVYKDSESCTELTREQLLERLDPCLGQMFLAEIFDRFETDPDYQVQILGINCYKDRAACNVPESRWVPYFA